MMPRLPSRPNLMFSMMEVAKRTGSCPTTPILSRSQPTLSEVTSRPSTNTDPASGSYSLCTNQR